jgi:ABC-type branched-subunit amino acid transport system ATPase component
MDEKATTASLHAQSLHAQDPTRPLAPAADVTSALEPVGAGAASASAAVPGNGEYIGAGAASTPVGNPSAPTTAATAPETSDASQGEVFAIARGLGLREDERCPFAGVDLVITTGQVTALRGRAGAGKTALLLTLAGRMVPTEGSLEVLGLKMPKQRREVARTVGMGLFRGLNDLPPSALVANVTASELARGKRPSKPEDVTDFLTGWGLQEMMQAQVQELSREELDTLGIALALIGKPRGLVVDDIETGLTRAQSERLMGLLKRIARTQDVAVMVACVSRDLAKQADDVYYMN